jgi:hypothetical protein
MILEHVGRLNDVIINADQDHVFFVHEDRPSGLPYGMADSLAFRAVGWHIRCF